MNRGTWNRFMIVLMAALIVFDLQQLISGADPENRSAYILSLGIAAVVIVLKVGEIRRTEAGAQKPS